MRVGWLALEMRSHVIRSVNRRGSRLSDGWVAVERLGADYHTSGRSAADRAWLLAGPVVLNAATNDLTENRTEPNRTRGKANGDLAGSHALSFLGWVGMSWGIAQSLLLALFTGWVGYVVSGRRWRQQERRTLYRDYLIIAHEALRILRTFEEEWDKHPTNMPVKRYRELVDQNRKVEETERELLLIAPWKVCGAASISVGIEGLLTEIFYREDLDDYETRRPPSYEWFHSRRHTYLWGPDYNDIDEFVNMARADLGAQSRLWRLRGDHINYRVGFPSWFKWDFAPRLPLVGGWVSRRNASGYEESVRASEEIWNSTRDQRSQASR